MFSYQSGEEIIPGDLITFRGDSGTVAFVVSTVEATGEPARNWYLDQFPGGGIMLVVENWGSVFVENPHEEEDLGLILRKP